MLVKTPELGRALAKSLGQYSIVLMRGHGATMVGTASIRQAVYRAVYAEKNARLQMEALRLGDADLSHARRSQGRGPRQRSEPRPRLATLAREVRGE